MKIYYFSNRPPCFFISPIFILFEITFFIAIICFQSSENDIYQQTPSNFNIPPAPGPCYQKLLGWEPFTGSTLIFTEDAVQVFADGVDGEGGLMPEIEELLLAADIPDQEFTVDAGVGTVKISLSNFDITTVSADPSSTFLIADFGFNVKFNKIHISVNTDFEAKMITFPYSEFSGNLVLSVDIDAVVTINVSMNTEVRPVAISLVVTNMDVSTYNLEIYFTGDVSPVLNTILSALSGPLSSAFSAGLTDLLYTISTSIFSRLNGGKNEKCTDDWSMQPIIMSNDIIITDQYMNLPHFGYALDVYNITDQLDASYPPYNVMPQVTIPDIVMNSAIQVIATNTCIESIYYDETVLRQLSDFDTKAQPDVPTNELLVPYIHMFTASSLSSDLPSAILNASIFSTFYIDQLSDICTNCDVAIRYIHTTDQWPSVSFSITSIKVEFPFTMDVLMCMEQITDPSATCSSFSDYTPLFSASLNHSTLGAMMFDTYDIYTQFEIVDTNVKTITIQSDRIMELTPDDVSSLLHWWGVLVLPEGLNDRDEDHGFQYSTRFLWSGYHGCITDEMNFFYSEDGYVAFGAEPIYCYVFTNDN
eukprot:gnl/Carplike_NY0171/2302_a3103_658.p1 GENE.gnl/Carplike_NY0171/2302_a3103_658~~gnl/Carplike_NY0171/2302_a3103_658.p1  ORF type:complete len:590 (+),score=72.19 gnl/Carplike_NY0171/2302_a3103_658:75-1844(+)